MLIGINKHFWNKWRHLLGNKMSSIIPYPSFLNIWWCWGGLTALTMWPANDCLQERSDHAWCRLTDVFGCKWYYAHAKMKPCFFPPWDRSCVKMADCFASQGDFSRLKNKLSDRMCLADRCLADQLFLCSPLKHQDIFRLPSSIIIVNCLSLKN